MYIYVYIYVYICIYKTLILFIAYSLFIYFTRSGLVDDYYLNLLSWGSNNIVAVGLGKCVYTWNASNEKVDLLLTLPDATDSVTSLQWNPKDNVIAVGTHHSAVQV
jgi:WD40 repeat protein